MEALENQEVTSEVKETVTTEPEMEQMRMELGRLTIPVLRQYLERFGYEAKEDVPKAELIDAMMKLHQRQVKESVETTAQAVAETESDDDPLVDMVFQNLECPGTPIEFTYQKGGFKVVNGKVKPAPKWSFMPGRTYKVPLSVANHLNSLRVPADKVNLGGDGFISNIYSGEKQNRFSCQIQFTDAQVRQLTKGIKT